MKIEHAPEDMTATVAAETTLAALQAELTRRGQWLPIDPSRPERLTIGAMIANNESGPRRFGYGTIRDYLLGIRVRLADGSEIKAGGKVVKNVAGYDLCKLFVGSRGSLGTILEATFKLRPLPEAEQFVKRNCSSLREAAEVTEKILDSPLTPIVLDLHNLESRSNDSTIQRFNVVLGFAGTREEVDWQLGEVSRLGISQSSNLDHDARFWAMQDSKEARKLSVLPSKVCEAIEQITGRDAHLGGQACATNSVIPFVCRAGNGIIWYRGGNDIVANDSTADSQSRPTKLMQRVKDAYDPKAILPSLPK